MTPTTDKTRISNKHYWTKIIVTTIIAFSLFFLEEMLSNPTGNLLQVSLAYSIAMGLVASIFGATAAGIMTTRGKQFLATFSSIYSAAIIVIAILIFLSVFFK
tara:strand:- start:90 stop:398 length:309 start_codon:yes stop_codon:yes gene_type:complete